MKTTKDMDDDQRKAAWESVTSPFEALEEIAAHSEFIGTDPYYRDLSDALWAMVERVLANAKPTAFFNPKGGIQPVLLTHQLEGRLDAKNYSVPLFKG